jgi:hypothetical protein
MDKLKAFLSDSRVQKALVGLVLAVAAYFGYNVVA